MAGEDLGELVEQPNGEACFYRDADHSYWRANPDGDGWKRGKRLTGVTSITKALDLDPSNLLRWAARTNGIGVAALATPTLNAIAAGEPRVGDLDWLRSAETIWAELTDAGMTFEDVREDAARVGTNIHRLVFEALAAGADVPDLAQLADDERGHARAVMRFWLDHSPAAEHVEQIVVSNSLGVAGRLDFRGRLNRCGDSACPCHGLEGPGIVDAKTGGYLAASAHAQVQGYRLLTEAGGFGPSDWATLLQLRADGDYRLIRAEGDTGSFLAALAAYREAGRINREAGKARRARGG